MKTIIIDTQSIDNLYDIIPKDDVILFCPQKVSCLNDGIARHADLQYHYIPEIKTLYHVKGSLTPTLKMEEIKIVEGQTDLNAKYPGDVICNVARCDNFAIGNKKVTDPILLDLLNDAGVEFINVNQGYSACSCLIVSDQKKSGVITADEMIYDKIRQKGIKVLLIPPQKNILLPGYNHGFIGGIAGCKDGVLYISGQLEYLESYHEIIEFLKNFDIRIVELSKKSPIDIGGMIFI